MRNPAFTRFNVFLRDRTCQYCGTAHAAADLTLTMSCRVRAAAATWQNVVAACSCNLRRPTAARPVRNGAAVKAGGSEYLATSGERSRVPAELSA